MWLFVREFAVFVFGVLVLCALMWILAPAAAAQSPDSGYAMPIHTTFYLPTGNPTASGEWPHDGTAGCSYDFPLGTIMQFQSGLTVRCDDRGNDASMAPHVDIFCAYDYQTCLSKYPSTSNWTIPVPARVIYPGR